MARRESLTDSLLQGAAGFGAVGGLMWALDHPATAPACPGQPGAPANGIGQCMTDGMMAVAKPYLVGGVCGALIGVGIVLTGLLLFRYMRGPARGGRSDSAFASTPPPTATAAAGRWMTARYSGRCARCGGGIAPGDRIRHRPGHTACVRCG